MLKTIDNPAQLKLDLFTTLVRFENTAPAIFHPIPKPHQLPNLKLAEKLEKLAAGMQKTIDNKLNPAIGNQNITARRSRIAAGMREEGEKLAVIQRWLEGLALAHRNGNCPAQFANINNRKQLEDLAWIHAWEKDDPKYLENCFVHNYSIVERLAQVGIKMKDEAIAAVDLLEGLCSGNPIPVID